MSSMKQVVYAGAFGALVAMQGCDSGETPQQVEVTAEGQTLQAGVESIVKAAEEQIEQFDAQKAVEKAEKVAEEHGVDVKELKEKIGEYKSMDAQQMEAAVTKAFNDVMASDDVHKVQESLQSYWQSFVSDKMSQADADKVINEQCSKTAKAMTNADAKKFVQALEAKFNDSKDYNESTEKILGQCKAGFSVYNLPCLQVSYKTLDVKNIKLKQNLDQPQPKDSKKAAPKAKEIYDVMPTNLSNLTSANATPVFAHIAQQVADAKAPNRRALMKLAEAVKAKNAALKPKPVKAKAAVKNGAKTNKVAPDATKAAADATKAAADAPAPAPAQA